MVVPLGSRIVIENSPVHDVVSPKVTSRVSPAGRVKVHDGSVAEPYVYPLPFVMSHSVTVV